MNVVHLSTYDLYGGAARAGFALHAGLAAAGVTSRMVVRQKRSGRADVLRPRGYGWWLKLQRRIDRLPLMAAPATAAGFSIGWTPEPLAGVVRRLGPDLVHVHWTADGFMRPETAARFEVPVVWTLHDMWAFTGGCHYSGECERYTAACGFCPLLGARHANDWSASGWRRRNAAFRGRRMVFIAPSRWMAQRAARSSVLEGQEIVVIPNGFDTTVFSPGAGDDVRSRLGVAPGSLVVLTGAADITRNPRKGWAHLIAALERLQSTWRGGAVELVVFGATEVLPAEVAGFRIRSVGVVRTAPALADVYRAADVFVAPSLADNLPNTVIEAMAVGIPVLGYDVGGVRDLIEPEETGLLAPAAEVGQLALALQRLLEDAALRRRCATGARRKAVRQFSLESVVAQHRSLYDRLLTGA